MGAPADTVSGIRWVGRQTGLVKSLSGFTKGKHTVPDAVNPATQAFLARLCADGLAEEAEGFFGRARTAFSYKRKDISLNLQSPLATLAARDFRLDWSYSLVESDPAQFEVVRTLSEVSDTDWLRSAGCDELFASSFSELTFSLTRGAPVEKVIDAVEGLEKTSLRVDYPSDYRWCQLSVDGVDADVRFEGRDLAMVFARPGSPAELWDGFARLRSAFRLTEDAVLSGFLG